MDETLFADNSTIELCGFGPIVAAVRTSQLIAQHGPKRVLLLGIAGWLSNDVAVGEAYEFGEVACFGIGAGSGDNFRTAGEMGWKQWAGPKPIADSLPLDSLSKFQLLTCPAASGNTHDVTERLSKYPNAAAEDMEGYAVAAACHLANVPLNIVRGISNRAGVRDQTQWKIEQAMASATQLASKLLHR